MNSVSYKGIIYIFRGLNNEVAGTIIMVLMYWILLIWFGTLEGAPVSRYGYTATLVN